MDSWPKGNNAPSVRSPMVDKERIRTLDDISWLGSVLLSFLQCSDTTGWVAGKGSRTKKPVPSTSKSFLSEKLRNTTKKA